jgi:hypothetical protein
LSAYLVTCHVLVFHSVNIFTPFFCLSHVQQTCYCLSFVFYLKTKEPLATFFVFIYVSMLVSFIFVSRSKLLQTWHVRSKFRSFICCCCCWYCWCCCCWSRLIDLTMKIYLLQLWSKLPNKDEVRKDQKQFRLPLSKTLKGRPTLVLIVYIILLCCDIDK